MRCQWGALRFGLVCCGLSIVTLPFIDWVWLGEIPLLALIQSPKLTVAHWCRSEMVMPAIKSLGFSHGSFSPDYTLARPYGLLLTYAIPVVLAGASLLLPGCCGDRSRRLVLWLLLALAVDAVCTWFLTAQRGLSLY